MASTDNNFTLEELGTFLKLLDDKMFTSLLDSTLQVLRSTSATGIFQTAMDFDPAIYKRLEGLQVLYADEFYELGLPKDCFNTFLFFMINFKDAYTCLLYETAKDFLGKNKGKGSRETTTTEILNRNQGMPDFTPTDMEIFEEPKHQSPVVPPVTQTKLNVQAQPYTPRGKKRVTYADVVTGSGSDDSRPTSPSPEEKWNIQQTSKKCSTNKKPQQQTTKKSKFTPEKTISTVMTGYTPVDKANVREIVIYDIPSTMPQLDILTNLGKWGQVIAFKVKTQKKYSTVTVSIDFNKWALTNWNNGVWTAPFGGMPASLDKALNTEFNFEEFKGVWTRYFSPTLNRPRNKPPKKTDSTQKQNQDKNLNVTQKDLDEQKQKGKSLGKKKQSTSKNKGFDGNDKLTILAEIRALLRSLAN
ncbi:unnamed protein product [Rhizophagus irregularis]|nr:unnamed protein product [Rhizophagus irregularis]